MGDAVEDKIISLLADPDLSPFGNPIPKPGQTLAQAVDRFAAGVISLEEVPGLFDSLNGEAEGPVTVRLERVGEYFQRDRDLLDDLWRVQAIPGATVTVEVIDHTIQIATTAGVSVFDWQWAGQLYVEGPN
jgi:DtxR family Mn-dependent transcriptional regulator